MQRKQDNNQGVTTAPNTKTDNRQEYKPLEVVYPQYGKTSTRERALKTKGADWNEVFEKSGDIIPVLMIY